MALDRFKSLFLASSLSALLWTGMPALAQDTQELVTPPPDTVIAIVNGHEIHASEVAMAADDIMGQLPDLPPKMRFPFIVDYLVERHLIAQQAVKDGIADSEEYKRRLALYQAKALRDAYLFSKVRPEVTDAELEGVYKKELAAADRPEQIRASHILVGSEKEAQDIEVLLKKGDNFAEVAKKYSLDGSKEFGGDLGYFTASEMVPEFSKVAFALPKGKISDPVKTDFGWHVIMVVDRKPTDAPTFEQVKTQLRAYVLRQKLQILVNGLKTTAKIEVIDPEYKQFMEDSKKYAESRKAASPLNKDGTAAPASPDAPAADAPAALEGEADGKGDLQAQ